MSHVAFNVDCDECPAKAQWTCKGPNGEWFFHPSRTAKAEASALEVIQTSENQK